MKKFLFFVVIIMITLVPLSSVAAAPAAQIDPLCLLEQIMKNQGPDWATWLGNTVLIHTGSPEAALLGNYLKSQGWTDVANSKWNGKIQTWEKPNGWKPPSSCNGGQSAGGGETSADKFNRLVGPTVLGIVILGIIGLIGTLGGRRLSPLPA